MLQDDLHAAPTASIPIHPMKASTHHRLVQRSISTAAVIAILLGNPLQSQAQPAAQAPKPKPATQEELLTYLTMAGINMCSLAQAKVPFKAAMEGNVSMLASVIVQKHGRQIVGSTAELTDAQVSNFTVAQTVLQVDRLCGKTIPAEWKKDFDGLLTEIKAAIEKAPRK